MGKDTEEEAKSISRGRNRKRNGFGFFLRLRPRDMANFGIKEVDFTAAKFNMGKDTEEKWIVTATGNHIIKWNFERVKAGYLQDYLICERTSNVSSGGFRFNRADEMLIAETDAVYCQTTRNRIP